MTTLAERGPLISAWAAVSPWGRDATGFRAGLHGARATEAAVDTDRWSVPQPSACLVPDFDIRESLGRKGTRSMDRVTGLAVTALGQLVGGEDRLPGIGPDTGLALGTSTGSAQSIMDFTRDSLVGEKPFFVDPARFPNTVMNCAAGQSAIWHGLKGPNTTIAGGRATGLLALQYALRLQRAERASTVLCGAVEEYSTARAWLDWHSRGGVTGGAPLGEGAAVWLMETAETAREHGRSGLATVEGLEFGFATGPEEIRSVLAGCLRALGERGGLGPDALWAVATSQLPGPEGEAERAALDEVLGDAQPRTLPCAELIGDTYAASAAFQITTVLAEAERDASSAGRTALVTSVERDGVVAAGVFRLLGGEER
ncbi:beta-ketoacyl synthase N-terminal-like domain-containing protein [Streptomyces sp. NPDC005955]|uniref:beta-ketoacyl synthase N-terminal-like domain-containing protein n=1 Tax=Streptomyces sp. NPDC005955 TaxID=3364738 RepID=UPI0036AAFB66